MPEPMIVGGCSLNGWRYATWLLKSVGVEDRRFRIAARLWPILAFGLLDPDRGWSSAGGRHSRRPSPGRPPERSTCARTRTCR